MRILKILLLLAISSRCLFAAGAGKARVQGAEILNEPLSNAALGLPTRTIFQRVIQARIFHAGDWTLKGSAHTPVTVGRTLASLQPSFLTGILRISNEGTLSQVEAEAYQVIRKAVLASSKACRFDVVMNTRGVDSGEEMARRIREISGRIHPDAWTFYVPPTTDTIVPSVFAQGIATAHQLGEMVGYDGPLSLIPEGADFIVVRAWDLTVNRKTVDLLRTQHHLPVIVELPTILGEQPSRSVVRYTDQMKSAERARLLSSLAENQNSWGYHFAYPVFYPLHPGRTAFDSTKDGTLLVTIRALMARFN
jgi:hypothetical protein